MEHQCSHPQTLPATWQRILGSMREQLTPMRAGDIEQALGLTQARMVLKRMADAGVIEQVAKGV
jgi:hypothetical protein